MAQIYVTMQLADTHTSLSDTPSKKLSLLRDVLKLAHVSKITLSCIGPSVNKEYLSQIQFYSICSELPVTSNTIVIITVCVKVANSTGFPQIKGQSGRSYRGTIYACCFVR